MMEAKSSKEVPARVLGDLSVHLRRVAALQCRPSAQFYNKAKQSKPPPEPPPGRPFRGAEATEEGSRGLQKTHTSAQG